MMLGGVKKIKQHNVIQSMQLAKTAADFGGNLDDCFLLWFLA